ncbi:MAG: TRAP transporter large permease subunit [Desulfobacterales bacterium]|nr:MAG: TRAP transporter large permease subunit [Desulfobacterales bacterium]
MELALGPLILTLFILLLVFLLSGMQIAFALMAVGLVGLYVFLPHCVPGDAARQAWNAVNSYPLTAVVLYIYMGELIVQGGVSEVVYESLDKWLGGLPGGLLHSVIGFCALFAAVSGSSVATAATIGTVAIPPMKKRNYDPKLMSGAMAAGGALGILIPPSVIMILYGALAGVSIAKCFFGGIIPGLILTLLFMSYIALRAIKSPKLAPLYHEEISWRQRFAALRGIVPVFFLAVMILSGIYLGIWTPTEAAAVGCLGTFLMIIVRKKLSRSLIYQSLKRTLQTSSMVLMILAGAGLVSYVMNYLRIPILLIEWINSVGLSPYVVLIFVCIIYYILGCFIEGISICIITVPIIFPAMVALGFDPIWFGIILAINIEVSLITPPVGMNLYVLKGIDADSKFGDIFVGVVPFVGMMSLLILILTIFPDIVTWLPNLISEAY